mmetsp:Transcript_79036/g.211205  ORF Transcript_79036/g.211205 Transcript_79036/m.211205 type:complete len:233 (-) Transcript_79036:178-876(-)
MSHEGLGSASDAEEDWQVVPHSNARARDAGVVEDPPPQPLERVVSSQSDVGRALALAALSWDNPKDLARETYQKKRGKGGRHTVRAKQLETRPVKRPEVEVSDTTISVPRVMQNGFLMGGYRYAPPTQVAQALGGSAQIMKTGAGRDAARGGVVTTQIVVPGPQPMTIRVQEPRGRTLQKAREGATACRRVFSPDWVYARQIHLSATKDVVNRAIIKDGIATFRADRAVMGV